jgi:hypothetical protein
VDANSVNYKKMTVCGLNYLKSPPQSTAINITLKLKGDLPVLWYDHVSCLSITSCEEPKRRLSTIIIWHDFFLYN